MRLRTSSAVALTSRPGRDPLQQPQDHPEVLHVGPHRLGDARVLDLDRDLAAVVQAGAVDLADRRGGDRRLVELGERPRRASPRARPRSTLRMSSKRTFGAASRSSPSLRWNSSRYSSGTSPTSRNDITCPSFIAAPFIVPSAVTICSAASMWRRSSACCLPSLVARQVRRRVPSWRARLARGEAARPAPCATTREVGIRSFAIAGG